MEVSAFDTKEFLQKNWEKAPLVQQGFLKGFEQSVNKKQLIDMSLDEYYETRLVIQEENKFSLKYGPFESENEIRENKLWTLLIHNLNLYNPKLRALTDFISFLPHWAFDDILCTFSSDGSTVGAHFDDYNVFIIQVEGQRKWSLQHNPLKTFKGDSEVKVLEKFDTDEEHLLCPGDMIYIPPHVAHEGISIGESVSLSIGFKSIELAELANQYSMNCYQQEKPHKLHSILPVPQSSSMEIDGENFKRIKSNFLNYLESEARLDEFLLNSLTRPKVEIEFQELEEIPSFTELEQNEFSRILFKSIDSSRVMMSVNGFSTVISSEDHKRLADKNASALSIFNTLSDVTKLFLLNAEFYLYS